MTKDAQTCLLAELHWLAVKHGVVSKDYDVNAYHNAIGPKRREALMVISAQQADVVSAIKEVIEAFESGVIGAKEEIEEVAK